MVFAGRSKLKVSKNFFSGGHLFVFVEYLCNRSLKIKTKNIKNCSSILAIVNHWNWPDDSPPLTRCLALKIQKSLNTDSLLLRIKSSHFIWFGHVSIMPQEKLHKQAFFAKANGENQLNDLKLDEPITLRILG